jgi:hypothetical protein
MSATEFACPFLNAIVNSEADEGPEQDQAI